MGTCIYCRNNTILKIDWNDIFITFLYFKPFNTQILPRVAQLVLMFYFPVKMTTFPNKLQYTVYNPQKLLNFNLKSERLLAISNHAFIKFTKKSHT